MAEPRCGDAARGARGSWTLFRQAVRLTPDRRELLTALNWQGQAPQLGPLAGQPDASATHRQRQLRERRPVILPSDLAPSLVGPPPDTVRVVFADEWMARSERRPLLDVGTRGVLLTPEHR